MSDADYTIHYQKHFSLSHFFIQNRYGVQIKKHKKKSRVSLITIYITIISKIEYSYTRDTLLYRMSPEYKPLRGAYESM